MHIRHLALALISGLTSLSLAAQTGKPSTPVTIVSPDPVPVSGTVQAQQSGNWTVVLNPTPTPLPVTNSLPATAFTISPTGLSVASSGSFTQTPDPSGTRYAITSVVLSNPTSNQATLTLTASAFPGASNCGALFNVSASAPGPQLTAPPNGTTILTFPQPFITNAVSGGSVCLAGGGQNGVGTTWSVVGYKILP